MVEDVGLRERKKIKIHKTIIEKAWKLFSEKGFENVKVSDIADQADISVKTLFTYFNSKEDILFAGEDELLDEIITAIHLRNHTVCISDSIADLIQKLMKDDDDPVAMGANELIKLLASNPVIQRRLLIMWQKYEKKLTDVLTTELNMEPGDLRTQVIACNLVLPFRMLFELKIKGEDKLLSDNVWLDKIMDIIKNGVRDF
jgi:Transcriptional regulator